MQKMKLDLLIVMRDGSFYYLEDSSVLQEVPATETALCRAEPRDKLILLFWVLPACSTAQVWVVRYFFKTGILEISKEDSVHAKEGSNQVMSFHARGFQHNFKNQLRG